MTLNALCATWSANLLLAIAHCAGREDVEIFSASDFFPFVDPELISFVVESFDFSYHTGLWQVSEFCKRGTR